MNRSPEQLQALVRYRLQQAAETLREASLLLDQSAWRGAQNRAYYAMFYAVLALLASEDGGRLDVARSEQALSDALDLAPAQAAVHSSPDRCHRPASPCRNG